MRSVQVRRANGPLELVERDIPEPGNRQVRIKVQACVIIRTTCKQARCKKEISYE